MPQFNFKSPTVIIIIVIVSSLFWLQLRTQKLSMMRDVRWAFIWMSKNFMLHSVFYSTKKINTRYVDLKQTTKPLDISICDDVRVPDCLCLCCIRYEVMWRRLVGPSSVRLKKYVICDEMFRKWGVYEL